jgi:hypothetical protein
MEQSYRAGLAPGEPHLANLPLASLQRAAFTGTFGGHLTNFPWSRHGAANAGADNIATATAAAKTKRIKSLPSEYQENGCGDLIVQAHKGRQYSMDKSSTDQEDQHCKFHIYQLGAAHAFS